MTPGCGSPDSPTPRTWELDAKSLYHSYRDSSERWTGQVVTVTLPLTTYIVASDELHWHSDRQTDPPDLVFVLAPGTHVPNNGETLVVTGTVRGRVEDGKQRNNRATHHVRIEGCTVSVQPRAARVVNVLELAMRGAVPSCCPVPAPAPVPGSVPVPSVGDPPPPICELIPNCTTGTPCIIYRDGAQSLRCLEAPPPGAPPRYLKADNNGPYWANV